MNGNKVEEAVSSGRPFCASTSSYLTTTTTTTTGGGGGADDQIKEKVTGNKILSIFSYFNTLLQKNIKKTLKKDAITLYYLYTINILL